MLNPKKPGKKESFHVYQKVHKKCKIEGRKSVYEKVRVKHKTDGNIEGLGKKLMKKVSAIKK